MRGMAPQLIIGMGFYSNRCKAS